MVENNGNSAITELSSVDRNPNPSVGSLSEMVDTIGKDVLDRYMQLKYEFLVDTLQIRTANYILRRWKSYKDLIRSFEMGGYVDHRKYKTKGKVEINQFYCERYLPFIKECVTWSNGDARLGLLKLKYPFLTEEQRRFVKDFEEGNGYLPVFYIIFNYVRSSDINKVIDLWYGFSAPEPMFIKEIANVFGKNVETIRLRKKNGIVFDRAQPHNARYLNELLDGNCRAPYNNYLPQPYITKSSEVFRDIDNRERLHGKFYAFTVIFRMLFPEYGNFKFCKSCLCLAKVDLFEGS